MEKSELEQLADRVGRSTNRLVGTGNRLIKAIERSNKTQDAHNKAIVWLTGVIAFTTVVYAAVTVWSTIIQPEQMNSESANDKFLAMFEVQALNTRFTSTPVNFQASQDGLVSWGRGLS